MEVPVDPTQAGEKERTEFLVDNNIAALGAQRYLYCIGQDVDTTQNCLARLFTVHNQLWHCLYLLSKFFPHQCGFQNLFMAPLTDVYLPG
jgi:hypothetical protein